MDAERGNRQPAHVLWTGGWDSTFRVLELVLAYGAEVQPYYVIDETRPSLETELRTMQRLREALAEHSPEGAARLRPTIHGRVDELEPNPVIARHARRMGRHLPYFGPQYEWLARFAEQRGLRDLEMSIEYCQSWDRMLAGHRRRVDGEHGEVSLITTSGPDCEYALWSRFRFGTFHVTKTGMERVAREHGFADLLEETWFCHRPTRRGRPCGTCGPCRYVRMEGLARRLPLAAHVRFTLYRAKYARQAVRRRLPRRARTGAAAPATQTAA